MPTVPYSQEEQTLRRLISGGLPQTVSDPWSDTTGPAIGSYSGPAAPAMTPEQTAAAEERLNRIKRLLSPMVGGGAGKGSGPSAASSSLSALINRGGGAPGGLSNVLKGVQSAFGFDPDPYRNRIG